MEKPFKSFLLLTLVFFFGCSQSRQNDGGSPFSLDEFRTYTIDVESKSIPISEVVESAEILGLEETPNSLLGSFYNIARLGDDFVFGDPKYGVIYTFDQFGKFKNKIYKKGIGPQEYSFLLNSWVEGTAVGVFDAADMRIHKYSTKGEHLGSSKLPYQPNEMHFWNGKYYLDVSRLRLEDGKVFGVLILNEDMTIFKRAVPMKTIKPLGIFWRSPFISYKDELTFHDAISDTIYVSNKDGLTPLMSIDFGEKWAWRDQKILLDRSKANEMSRRRSFVNKFRAAVSSKYVLVQHYWQSELQFDLIDRLAGEVRRLDLRGKSKTKLSLEPYFWDGDRLLVSLQSTDVAEFIETLGKTEVKFREGTTLDKIESSENAVLLWLSFK